MTEHTAHPPPPPPAHAAWWEGLPGLVLVVDDNGEPVHASPALAALCAPTSPQAHCLDALTPDTRLALHERLKTRTDFELELELEPAWRDATPHPRWFACSATWLSDASRYLCVWVEITASKVAERQASSRSRFLRTFCNAIPVMVSYYSYPLRCMYANQHYARQYGFDETSIVGLTVEQVLGRHNAEALPFRQQAFEQREAVTYERSFMRENHRIQWVRVTEVPLLDAQGGFVGSVAMNQDITPRREAELALRESEDRLARFMEASAEGVLFHRDGRITDVNPAACALYGSKREELLGMVALSRVAPEYLQMTQRVIASGADASYESEIFNAQGERLPVQVIGRSMLRNGEHLRMAVVRDIRDRREAQARIEELISGLRAEKERAEAADRAKSVFLAAASHDLRQPIHALGLFLTALRSMAQAPAVPARDLSDICRRMQASLDGLGQLLNMLLDVSRLDANAVEIAPEPTDLGLLLRELEQDFQHLAHEKGLRLRVAPCSLWVHTDPTVLRRILSNLLSNAVRYTPRGRILLGCRRRASELDIQVWDTGIGIPPEQREAIFEEFYQVGQSTAQHHESHGLGLGLSIVKRSAQLLQAPMGLRSQPARGSMFFIRLPRCAAPARSPAPALAPAYPGSTRGLGVLVIDDDAQVLDAMQRVLSVWGHRAFCASSADEAVVIAITHPEQIHLLLSDYRLGANVTAVDAIRAVQACLPHPVPTYILTGDTSPQRILEASALGFPLMRKPLQAAALRAILDAEAAAAAALA